MGAWADTLAEARKGILLHYDASASDPSAIAWLRDPRCKVSYNWIVMDNGGQETVAPIDARAYHAGACRPSGPLVYKYPNSALYGIAIAAKDGDRATPAQMETVARLCVGLFIRHNWDRTNELYRIVGHDTECWPRGRKPDPTGSRPSSPVLSVTAIREMVRA